MTKEKSIVAILIPAHRAEHFLPATLESVLGQTYEDWKIYILEDGVYDNTGFVIKQYIQRLPDKLVHIVNPESVGISSARNQLLNHVVEPYFAFLDSDDTWEPYHLEKLLDILRASDKQWIVSGHKIMDAKGEVLKQFPLTTEIEMDSLPGKLLQFNFFLMGALVFKTSSVPKSLRFCSKFTIGEDLHFWIELIRVAGVPAVAPECSFNYRKHSQSITSNSIRFSEEYAKIAEFYLGDPIVDPKICRHVLRNHLHAVARMTWRKEPERCMNALWRLFRQDAANLKTWYFYGLARILNGKK